MTLPREELKRRKIAELKREMRAHMALAMEKATIIEELEGGVYPPQPSIGVLTDAEIARIEARSKVRRKIPDYQNGDK